MCPYSETFICRLRQIKYNFNSACMEILNDIVSKLKIYKLLDYITGEASG